MRDDNVFYNKLVQPIRFVSSDISLVMPSSQSNVPIVRLRDVRHVENGTLHPLDRKTSAILIVVVVVAVVAVTVFVP